MSTVRSRIQKGRQFQKIVMELFKNTFDLDEEAIRTPVGAENGPDLVFSRAAQKIVGITPELKNQKNMNIWSAIEQAKKNCKEGSDEAVIFKRGTLGANKTYICIPLDNYLILRKKLLEYEGI